MNHAEQEKISDLPSHDEGSAAVSLSDPQGCASPSRLLVHRGPAIVIKVP